jgi:flagellar FliJ protein
MAKKFRWRLDPVKKVKEREEERNQEALAEARRALRSEEARLADLVGQRSEAVRQLQDIQQGALDPRDLAMRDAYVRSLNERIQAQAEAVEAARRLEAQKQEALVKAVQERKVFDNLKERDRERFRKAQQRKEQAATDETANRQSHGNRNREE